MKNISIIGSTGSVGTQTLDVVSNLPDKINVVGLAANTNIELLKKQIEEFKPLAACVMDKEKADELRSQVDIDIYSGMDGLIKISTMSESELLVNSVVGSIGLKPTLEAIKNKKTIALANKETLVTGGRVVMDAVSKNNVPLLPLDSEHSALFQCLNGENMKQVSKLQITCSGGPFNGKKKEDLMNVTVKEALDHPTWKMGGKITIDSATLMNKGFEVIEARWLFDMPYDKIDVVVHPQSIIHSLVEFNDHNVIAQLGDRDMRLPIYYALTYPDRLNNNIPSLNLAEIGNLSFLEPDLETFPCLKYAFDAGKVGGTLPVVLNATNEIAVYKFLDSGCKYLDIPGTIKKVMDSHNVVKNPELDDILDADKWARKEASKILGGE